MARTELKMTFDLPEEQDAFHRAVHSAEAFRALYEISEHLFRPNRRNGYVGEIGTAIDGMSPEQQKAVSEVVLLLEAEFCDIVNDKGLKIFT